MPVTTVAICGGGHGALAAAADLTLRGFEVRLALRNPKRFERLFETQRIQAQGVIEGEVRIPMVTTNHAQAAKDSDVVLIPLPANAQLEMARTIARVIEVGQVIYVTKGTFSAPFVAVELARAGAPSVPIVETAILPYLARTTGPDSVTIRLTTEHLPTAVYPTKWSGEGLAAALEMYPATEPALDVLDVALLNSDPALHAPLVMLNAGAIQGAPEFNLHRHGNSSMVKAVALALDNERITLRGAAGYDGYPWPLANLYSDTEPTYYGVAIPTRMQAHPFPREVVTFDHRYVTEDIECGLSFWASLAHSCSISIPLAEAFLTLATAITGVDYSVKGRTLASLGLNGLDPKGIRAALHEGLTHFP